MRAWRIRLSFSSAALITLSEALTDTLFCTFEVTVTACGVAFAIMANGLASLEDRADGFVVANVFADSMQS